MGAFPGDCSSFDPPPSYPAMSTYSPFQIRATTRAGTGGIPSPSTNGRACASPSVSPPPRLTAAVRVPPPFGHHFGHRWQAGAGLGHIRTRRGTVDSGRSQGQQAQYTDRWHRAQHGPYRGKRGVCNGHGPFSLARGMVACAMPSPRCTPPPPPSTTLIARSLLTDMWRRRRRRCQRAFTLGDVRRGRVLWGSAVVPQPESGSYRLRHQALYLGPRQRGVLLAPFALVVTHSAVQKSPAQIQPV